MKVMLAIAVGLMMFTSTFVSAQVEKAGGMKSSAKVSPVAAVLEPKVRKAWEDYKNRDKQAFGAMLAPGFGEVTNDAEGVVGKEEELAEIDHFTLAHYELSHFKVRPLGSVAALVTYSAEYSGSYDNSPLNMKTVYGEVWVKNGGNWQVLWVQETKVK